MAEPQTFPPALDLDDVRALLDGCMEQHGRAFLAAVGDHFVMTGPSGTHSLLIGATDYLCLDAHWRLFASHPLNGPQGVSEEVAAI